VHEWETSQVGVFLRFYGLLYPALGANPMNQFFGASFFEARRSSESLEPLISFIAYLEPKLWHKNKRVVKISTTTNANLGLITPILYMAITLRQNMLESCSSPLKTRDFCSLDWKKILSWDLGSFVDVYIMSGCLCTFFTIGWLRHPLGIDQSSRFCGSTFFGF